MFEKNRPYGPPVRARMASPSPGTASRTGHVDTALSASQRVAERRQIGIAGVQMHVAGGEDSIPRMARLVAQIRRRFPWVTLFLFPELCVFGPDPARAQTLPGDAEARLAEIARRNGVWLLPGSLFERSGNTIFNTTPVIAPTGVVVARYRKMFPFRPYENGVESGAEFVAFDIADTARAGVSICYDMWFPETTRTLAAMGAEVILHPTLTDTIDRDVELAIARASAATNQCYFFDINGVGDGGVGRSIVVDPSGYVLHEGGHGEEVIPLLIDLDRVRTERESGLRGLGQPLKSFRDRRVEFTIYDRSRSASNYLQALGPLAKPGEHTGGGTLHREYVEETDVVRSDTGGFAQAEKK
jgi:predicted amidohydrolase